MVVGEDVKMRYDKFEIIKRQTEEVLYSSLTIGAIKKYIAKKEIPIDGGSTGIAIKCHHRESPLICSLDWFYANTHPVNKEIMQQVFASDLRAFRAVEGKV